MARRDPTTVSHTCFFAIDPLRPPSDRGPVGRLAAVIAESTTWFFAGPIIDRNRDPVENGPRQLAEVIEAVEIAHGLLRQEGVDVDVVSGKKTVICDRRGFQLVDLFCDRYIRKEGVFSKKLNSGRVINQRQLLCAMTLHQAEQTARAVKRGDATAVCNLMEDILELMCERRRALDREAGSTIAARRARQRHEKHDRIRARACSLYDQQKWPSARKAAQKLFLEIQQFSREVESPLSLDSGELTVYKWFRAHRNRVRA